MKDTYYIWGKFNIINHETNNFDIIITDNIKTISRFMNFYVLNNDKLESLDEVKLINKGKAYYFNIKPGETKTYYFRSEFFASSLDFDLLTYDKYTFRCIFDYFFYGLFLGILVIMIFYNLFLFFSFRDKSYIFYILTFSTMGFLIIFLLSGIFPQVKHEFLIYLNLKLLFVLFFGLFTKYYLITKNNLPFLDKIILGVLGIYSLFTLFSNFIRFDHTENISGLLIAGIFIFYFGVGIITLIKGYRPALYFILAILSIVLIMVFINLSGIGFMPFEFSALLKNKTLDISTLTMVFLFSLGLADRINSIRKEKEKSDELAITNLEKANRLKDEFLTNTSHELRTPLTGIIGLADSLLEGNSGEIPAEAKQVLKILIASGRRLASLINDILDLAKLKNKEMKIEKKPVDIKNITDICFRILKPLLKSKTIKLVNDISIFIPPIAADSNKLQQIMLNLIGNSIKFTFEGEIRVTAKESYDKVYIGIEDTGIGIPNDNFEAVFNYFEQVDSQDTRMYGGTGLGLSITRQLVELHSGKIWIDKSEVGKGTSILFYIPKASQQLIEENINNPEIELNDPKFDSIPDNVIDDSGDKELNRLASNKNMDIKILIVDDEVVIVNLLRNVLKARNFDVYTALSGPEAIEKINKDFIPDILLLDVMMPGMTGYEVCRKLREKYTMYELPIIMLTAKTRITELVEGFNSGTNDYLTKPFNNHELIKRIESLLSLKKLTETNYLLQTTNELKSRLLRMASHDIKTPVTSIKLYSGYLEKKALVEHEGLSVVEKIKLMADKINHLITNILDNARIKDGKLILNKEKMNLIEILNNVIISNSDRAALKKQKILFKPGYNNLTINADKYRIEQIFENLFNNAIKYSPENKKIQIIVEKSDEKNSISVIVKDEGLGFSEEDKENVFKEFKTGSAIPTHNESSTGLGLSIVKGLVDLHDGKIWLESEKGKGSSFYVELPWK